MRTQEGLKSEALRAALETALAGRPLPLEHLLAQHGGVPGKVNVKLAAAFANEIARRPGTLAPLLTRMAAETAAPDDPRAFLPVAAAHGWAQRLQEGREVEPAWLALLELSADERSPVRVGTLQALLELALHAGAADELVQRATGWLQVDDRELAFGSSALVIEVLGDPRALPLVREHEALLAYLSQVIDKVASAPRAAHRSEGRRRVLMSLGGTVASVVALVRGADRGALWFRAEAERAKHPDLRAVLSQALIKLGSMAHAAGSGTVEELRQTLEGSAKPIRDAARVRPGLGHGRGRRSRPTR
jgi:hypothetical protein